MSTKKPAKAASRAKTPAKAKKPAAKALILRNLPIPKDAPGKTIAYRAKPPQKVTPAKKPGGKVTATPKPGSGRRRIDLERMELDYRTGRFSDQELADKHGVARETVCRNAKRLGWTKDLKDAIRQATSAALAQVASQEASGKVTSVIAENAELNKQVIIGHRVDIKLLRDEAFQLLAELKSTPENADIVEDITYRLAELERQSAMTDGEMTEKEREKRLSRIADEKAAIRKQVREMADIHNRVGSMQKLSDILVKLQGLERKAFDLDRDGGKDGGYEALLDQALT